MDDSIASRLRLKVSRLVAERQRLEKTLMESLTTFLDEAPCWRGPNSVVKAGCKCTKGQPHPPGPCLSRLVDRTVRQVFIRADQS